MASDQEIAIRAVGTALAGLSIAFAAYMLAYGGGKTRVNGMEYLAIFAQPRGVAVVAPAVKAPAPPPVAGAPAVDMATTGSLADVSQQSCTRTRGRSRSSPPEQIASG